MHDLGNRDCTQASLCGCTRPERANVAFSCVCIALPAPKQQSVAWCSLFTLCWQEYTQMHGQLLSTDCTQASSYGCISPEDLSYCLGVRGALPAPRHQSIAWCSLFSLTEGKETHRCMT